MVGLLKYVVKTMEYKYRDEEVWRDLVAELEKAVPQYLETYSEMHKKILQYSKEGNVILEIGCGSGVTSSYLQKNGRSVVGLDYSVHALKAARETGNYFNLDICLVRGDVFKLPFKANCFGTVINSGVLHYYNDVSGAMEECGRVLKKGGYLLIDVPYTYSIFTVEKRIRSLLDRWPWGQETQYSYRELRRLVKKHGLDAVDSYGWGLDGLSNLLFNFHTTKVGKKLPSIIQKIYNLFAAPVRSFLIRRIPTSIGLVCIRS